MSLLSDFTAIANDHTEFSFNTLEGKVVLIVNTASKCGFTPQYSALEELYQTYKDRGFVVIGFPCDQFGHQEPGSDEEIATFCTVNHGVTFPLMGKIKVNGKETHPLYAWLKNAAPGSLGNSIKWNFTKFLVSKDGSTVKRFAPKDTPDMLVPYIEEVL